MHCIQRTVLVLVLSLVAVPAPVWAEGRTPEDSLFGTIIQPPLSCALGVGNTALAFALESMPWSLLVMVATGPGGVMLGLHGLSVVPLALLTTDVIAAGDIRESDFPTSYSTDAHDLALVIGGVGVVVVDGVVMLVDYAVGGKLDDLPPAAPGEAREIYERPMQLTDGGAFVATRISLRRFFATDRAACGKLLGKLRR